MEAEVARRTTCELAQLGRVEAVSGLDAAKRLDACPGPHVVVPRCFIGKVVLVADGTVQRETVLASKVLLDVLQPSERQAAASPEEQRVALFVGASEQGGSGSSPDSGSSRGSRDPRAAGSHGGTLWQGAKKDVLVGKAPRG